MSYNTEIFLVLHSLVKDMCTLTQRVSAAGIVGMSTLAAMSSTWQTQSLMSSGRSRTISTTGSTTVQLIIPHRTPTSTSSLHHVFWQGSGRPTGGFQLRFQQVTTNPNSNSIDVLQSCCHSSHPGHSKTRQSCLDLSEAQ